MDIKQIAAHIADASCVGYQGIGLEVRIKRVVIDTLTSAEPEARRLERDHAIAVMAHKGTVAQFRIQIAGLKRDKARLRREWANAEIDHTEYQLTVKQWESRTGLDMNQVLKDGVHGNPLGSA